MTVITIRNHGKQVRVPVVVDKRGGMKYEQY